MPWDGDILHFGADLKVRIAPHDPSRCGHPKRHILHNPNMPVISSDDIEQTYQRRSQQRLKDLLDYEGFSSNLAERASALAARASIPHDEALQLISGSAPWSWRYLHAMAEYFEISPGYFIDEDAIKSLIATKARTVTSAEGGEAILWSLPTGLTPTSVTREDRLRYVTRELSTPSGKKVALYVFKWRPFLASELEPGEDYLIETESGNEIVRYRHKASNSAIFTSTAESTIYRIPIPVNPAKSLEMVRGRKIGFLTLD